MSRIARPRPHLNTLAEPSDFLCWSLEELMKSELSWKGVAIIAILVLCGVATSLLGDKSLGASLVGGALGYLAQGFGYRRDTPPGTPQSVLPEQSERIIPKLPSLMLFAGTAMVWILFCF